jgi:hypothetical protein
VKLDPVGFGGLVYAQGFAQDFLRYGWDPTFANRYDMAGYGTAVLDFGTPGGLINNKATVAITGQAGITSGSYCEAFLMGDATALHNADEHLMVEMSVRCSVPTAGVGFTITAASEWGLTGTFNVRWVWI